MKNLLKARIAHIFGIVALVAIIGFSFTSCGEERPSGTGWPSSGILKDYSLPETQPTEASSISWEVDENDYLIMYLTWSTSASRTFDSWLGEEGWGSRDPSTGVDKDGHVAYKKIPWVLVYTAEGSRYVIVIAK